MTALPAAPGVVLAVWTDARLPSDLIRAGESLMGLPAVANHVVIITHRDPRGRWIGIEGRPGGVGLCDCLPYLTDSRTRSNYGQLTAIAASAGPAAFSTQLTTLLASCAKSIGVRYDWAGIAEDAADALHLNDLTGAINAVYGWPADHHLVPGEVVCSSLAAWQYENVSWAHPGLGTERNSNPAEWWNWNDKQLWLAA